MTNLTIYYRFYYIILLLKEKHAKCSVERLIYSYKIFYFIQIHLKKKTREKPNKCKFIENLQYEWKKFSLEIY